MLANKLPSSMQTTYELNLLATKAFARFLRKHLFETNFTPFGVHVAVSVALQQPNIHGGVAKWKSILNKKRHMIDLWKTERQLTRSQTTRHTIIVSGRQSLMPVLQSNTCSGEALFCDTDWEASKDMWKDGCRIISSAVLSENLLKRAQNLSNI